jgi:hypothetical protein
MKFRRDTCLDESMNKISFDWSWNNRAILQRLPSTATVIFKPPRENLVDFHIDASLSYASPESGGSSSARRGFAGRQEEKR